MGGVCEGECMGRSPGDVPLTLTRCHSCGLPQLHKALEGWKSICGRGGSREVVLGAILPLLLTVEGADVLADEYLFTFIWKN